MPKGGARKGAGRPALADNKKKEDTMNRKLEKILQVIPVELSIPEMEKELIRQAASQGISAEQAEKWLLGGDI